MAGLGGGDAWAKDHDKILAHARGLKYDKVPGVTLPAADAPKEEWIPAMDAFNAWKAGEVAKEPSGQAWWQTNAESPAPESSGGESGSRGGGLLDSGPPPMGPYPEANVYFPMLVPEYAPPTAQDWTSYMPRVGPYDAPTPYLGGGAPANFPQATLYPGIGDNVDAGIPDYNIGGLLYQPWTTEYQQAFVPPNIWNYEPNQFGVGPVQFMGAPFGPINVVPPEELFTEEEEEEEDQREGSESRNESPDQSPSTIPDSTTYGPSDIRLKKNIKFLGKSNTLDINKLRSNSI